MIKWGVYGLHKEEPTEQVRFQKEKKLQTENALNPVKGEQIGMERKVL